MPPFINRVGMRFGRWTVGGVVRGASRKDGASLFEVFCDCGTIKITGINDLVQGKSKSCGCLKDELQRVRLQTHGLSKNRFYKTWLNMMHRCFDETVEDYRWYGAIGVIVCDEWHSPSVFIAWCEDTYPVNAAEKLSIDRYPNQCGNYEPLNCRWATAKEQGENKRNSVILNTPEGRMSISDAAKKFGLTYGCLSARINRGWSQDRLFDSRNLKGANQFSKLRK
jgi:hypothetical protein